MGVQHVLSDLRVTDEMHIYSLLARFLNPERVAKQVVA